MSLLTSFPAEVLDLVAGYLDASAISHLLQVGDRNLWSKLTIGAQKQLHLSWTSVVWLPWPVSFIRYFSELTILEWRDEDSLTCCPKLDLSVLPPTLKRICIDANDVFCLLRIQKCRLGQQLPNLTDLELHGTRIAADNFENLPTGLTALHLDSHHQPVSVPNLFGKLPRSLLSLDLVMHVTDPEDLQAPLPPGLTRLRAGLDTRFDWLKEVPHSVTYLHFATESKVRADSLPPDLRELVLMYPSELPLSEVSKLPVTLAAFEGHIENSLTDHLISLLPPNLTRLDTGYGGGVISKEALQQAPSGLVDLRTEIETNDCDILQSFNLNSTTIRLSRNVGNHVAIPLTLHPFPLKLTRLKLGCFTDELCMLLPAELECLFIAGGNITAIGASRFGTLHHLRKVDLFIDTIDDEVVPYLSRIKKLCFWTENDMTIESLKLSFDFLRLLLSPSASESSPNSPEAHPSSDSKPLDAIGTNNSIENLTLHFDSWDDAHLYLPKASFRALGCFLKLKNLRILAVSHNINPNWLRHLPRQLLHCSVEMLSTYPSNWPLYHKDSRLCTWTLTQASRTTTTLNVPGPTMFWLRSHERFTSSQSMESSCTSRIG